MISTVFPDVRKIQKSNATAVLQYAAQFSHSTKTCRRRKINSQRTHTQFTMANQTDMRPNRARFRRTCADCRPPTVDTRGRTRALTVMERRDDNTKNRPALLLLVTNMSAANRQPHDALNKSRPRRTGRSVYVPAAEQGVRRN